MPRTPMAEGGDRKYTQSTKRPANGDGQYHHHRSGEAASPRRGRTFLPAHHRKCAPAAPLQWSPQWPRQQRCLRRTAGGSQVQAVIAGRRGRRIRNKQGERPASTKRKHSGATGQRGGNRYRVAVSGRSDDAQGQPEGATLRAATERPTQSWKSQPPSPSPPSSSESSSSQQHRHQQVPPHNKQQQHYHRHHRE
uniref:(northern house mosquito) hypothetical protein n=1 Tax=Culex pipiens TaxID=7175 RepID=A0A8D8C125_CULPI